MVFLKANTKQWKIGVAALGPRCSFAAKEQLRRKMQDAYETSQGVVPVDTGALKKSGRLEERDGDWGHPLEIDLIYGGGEVDYAGWVEIFEPYLEESAVGSVESFDSAGDVLEGPFD